MELPELAKRMRMAISAFLDKEADLLKQDAKEEAITTQLITYLKREFGDWKWNIDHQYNRRVINNEVVQKRTNFAIDALPKSKIPKTISPDLEIITKRIVPDIIFHDRSSQDHNFLVIEVKLTTNNNKDERAFDSIKLEVMTSTDLKYNYGLFLDFTSGQDFNPDEPYYMRFITNGKWQ